ncbi:MAG: FHA domain-containing protein [Acaryochloris sp. RU_4_1]|nr:FHA domain-containing protein [Acaryochloris sp. SU_5_25]NJM66342.1 FHA domain-containing protein [Acaryochloris sp. RU_4_1]NJR54978.1 FHA domain-containing protein [Acaryochloris sp. CRU_2_0]
MIICPHCLHQNPNNTPTCEVCQTTLPTASSCPNCGASMQLGAQFCGQCGFNLAVENNLVEAEKLLNSEHPDPPAPWQSEPDNPFLFPPSQPPDPLVVPDFIEEQASDYPPQTQYGQPDVRLPFGSPTPLVYAELAPQPSHSQTQLQQQTVQLIHMQTNTTLDLPLNLKLIHLGKPNKRVPPDIDVSSFPNAEVVSRVHADIRVEGGHYFIEDVGSSNGTYINNVPLLPGNRHRLRLGDRIALGKGNLVTFVFQLN